MAFAPNFDLVLVPSRASNFLSIATWFEASIPKISLAITVFTLATLEEIDTALGAWKKALPKKIGSRENYIRHAIWTAFNLQRHIPIRSDLIKAKLLTTTQSKKMGDLPKDFNYIIINKTGKPTGTLYLNNTKTSNTFTNTTVPIPENVVKTLRSLLPHLEKYSVGVS